MPMSFLSFLFGRNKKSAHLAKQRLQAVLATERSARGQRRLDYLPALQRELVGVVSKYVKVSSRDVKVRVEHQRHGSILDVRVELPEVMLAQGGPR